MAYSVTGKNAVITGAGSGINLAFAKLLISKGCSVLIADLTLRPEAEQLVASGEPGKPRAYFHRTDVSSWSSLSSLMDEARRLFPTIDIVVPGAGIFEPAWSNFWLPPGADSQSRDKPDGDRYAVLDINLTHPIRLSQLALGYWTEKKMPGCLVCVSSIAGYASGIGTPLYFASKHGLTGFVRSLGGLRDELGIRVGAVAPGAVITPMWSEDPLKKDLYKSDGDPAFTEPEEIAVSMLELCENPEYGNGTILEVKKGAMRVVPEYNADPPSGEGFVLEGYLEMQKKLYKDLKDNGLKV